MSGFIASQPDVIEAMGKVTRPATDAKPAKGKGEDKSKKEATGKGKEKGEMEEKAKAKKPAEQEPPEPQAMAGARP